MTLHLSHFGRYGTACAFERGRLKVVLGRNGAGKTTLLSVLSGLLRPAEGCVHIDGRDATDEPPGRGRSPRSSSVR